MGNEQSAAQLAAGLAGEGGEMDEGRMRALMAMLESGGGGGGSSAVEEGEWSREQEALRIGRLYGPRTDSGIARPSPLGRACVAGHGETALVLLEAGSDPLAKDAGGRSCLHLAAYGGCVSVIERLLEQVEGVEVNEEDLQGETPLMGATYKEQHEAMELLIAAGQLSRPLSACPAENRRAFQEPTATRRTGSETRACIWRRRTVTPRDSASSSMTIHPQTSMPSDTNVSFEPEVGCSVHRYDLQSCRQRT